jgi:hypothetical protein
MRPVTIHCFLSCESEATEQVPAGVVTLRVLRYGWVGSQAMWVPEDTSGLWERWLGRGCSAAVQWVRFLCNVHSDAAAATCMRRLQPLDSHMEVTDCVALDCEMVGVGPGTPSCTEQSHATPQTARGWASPPCRHFKLS